MTTEEQTEEPKEDEPETDKFEELFKAATPSFYARPKDEPDLHRYTRRPAIYRPVNLSGLFEGNGTDLKVSEERVHLWPSTQGRRRRLNCQADEVRARLEDPSAVMLVLRGTTYSAKSVAGVVWLYLKVRFLKRWARRHYPTFA